MLDRDYYDVWREAGASDLAERCRAQKEEILANHETEPMPQDVKRAVSEIVSSARRNLGD